MFEWKEIAMIGMAGLVGLVAYTVNAFVKRLDQHEKDDGEKFGKLFDGQADISSKISDGFAEMNKTINTVHIKLIERINEERH